MAFEANIRKAVHDYASGHIGDEGWHTDHFDFLADRKLAKRLGEEFISARYIYKLLEGLEAKDWLLRAQIRIQIMSYASIYEAAIHSLLFTEMAEDPAVVALTEFPMKKEISIPRSSLGLLQQHLEHDGRKIIPTYEGVGRTDESKVRFDRKADCVCSLGIVEPWLRDELIEFYEARNAIHIHAEIRKSLTYEIDLGRRAYMRMQPFRDQIVGWRLANP